MASAVHCQLNPQVRLFVPTAMTSKLAYSTVQYSTVHYSTVQYSTVQHRHGKREEGQEPASKHQICPGDGTWTGRRGVERLNPRRENKVQGKNGDREGVKIEKVAERRKSLARKRRRRDRAERRRLYDRAKVGIEHVREDGRPQLPRTTSGRWRWMVRAELDGRWIF